MKIARFEHGGKVRYGIVEGDVLVEFSDVHPADEAKGGENVFAMSTVRLLAPTAPLKVVAVGLNYLDHAKEMGMAPPEEPIIFLKPSTAVIGPGDDIIMPKSSTRVDYEGELGVVIGRRAKDVSVADAKAHIFGYTCLNDVTARDLQFKDVQFTRAKSFDTFCPIGPWVETELDPYNLAIETRLNGKTVQSSNTAQMKWGVYELVSFISGVMTLLPGDVIATGTPPGIGPTAPGDRVEVSIAGIGTLTNQTRSSA
jgi:2-keto-4-pentenoate hydratase/2-oxohepta-3-ene-1,7-dioic acid hydratase in catechol pathway